MIPVPTTDGTDDCGELVYRPEDIDRACFAAHESILQRELSDEEVAGLPSEWVDLLSVGVEKPAARYHRTCAGRRCSTRPSFAVALARFVRCSTEEHLLISLAG